MSLDPSSTLPHGDQVYWPYPVPNGKSACTTTNYDISRYCCDHFLGVAIPENRASPVKQDTNVVQQANCLSTASPDEWSKCAHDNLNGTSKHMFFAYCNYNARILNSAAIGGINLGKLGTLSVVAAAALSLISAI